MPHAEGLALPAYETAGAAGLDLRAAVPDDRPMLILPGKRALVPTGLVLEIPEGFEGQVRPRSGLAFNHGITCLNTPGTIDSDYRGEVKVLLVNLGDEDSSWSAAACASPRSSSPRSPAASARGAQPGRRHRARLGRLRLDRHRLMQPPLASSAATSLRTEKCNRRFVPTRRLREAVEHCRSASGRMAQAALQRLLDADD